MQGLEHKQMLVMVTMPCSTHHDYVTDALMGDDQHAPPEIQEVVVQ
jgi:hypothetical protein